jgi:hypothetical protein
MSKNKNINNKQSHCTRNPYKPENHWKHGKSSGNPELSKARRDRKQKQHKKGQK